MNPLIVFNDYKLFKIIGKGSFGEVYLTQKGDNQKLLATKCLDLRELNKDLQKYLKNEIVIMRKLKHQNIIQLIEVFHSKNHFYVIMEYCNGGTLSDCLKRYGKPFSIEIIQYLMRQIIEGLKYIHSKKIIHRDIKLENILVNFKNEEDKKNLDLLKSEIKIIDFGLAIEVGPDGFASTTLGTPANMDPIIVKKFNKAGGFEKLQKYNAKADIWSLGTICYEMFTGKELFQADNLEDLFLKSEKGEFSIPFNKELSNEFISFINAMLQYDHKKRYSAEELSQHNFIKKNINEFIKPELNLISHRIEGNNLNIGSKDNKTIWDIFNKKDKEEIKEKIDLKSYIDGLLDEYKSANNYFEENNLIKQMENANNICLKIENIKKQFELGNNNDLISLPQPIDPQFIYGCSLSERNKKFKEIISKCLDDKNQLESKINSLDKNSFQNNNEIKKEYDNDIVELEKLNNNIKELQNKINHIWIPAPQYIKESKQCQIEKIYDFNLIKIYIKKDDNKQNNINLIISLKSDELIILSKEVKLNNENNFNDKFDWKIGTKKWINVDKFLLKIENKNYLNNKNPFKIKINIGKIKNGKAISFNCSFSEDHKDLINFIVKPILLEGKKYISNEVKDEVNLKIYPPFKGKSPATKNIPKFGK